MPNDTFKEFVLDELRALPELVAKAIFGGHGFYSGAHFFAILAKGRLYFKVDAAGRAAYRRLQYNFTICNALQHHACRKKAET